VAPERIWKWGGHTSCPKRRKFFCRAPPLFLALQVQLVVLVSAFVVVSTLWSVSCLLFFYSWCLPCPAICKSGNARVLRALWSIFSFFIVINHDFIIYIDFTHIVASNTATRYCWRHKLGHIECIKSKHIIMSCSYFNQNWLKNLASLSF